MLNMGFPLEARIEKTVDGLSGDKSVSGTTASKESHANSLLGYERNHYN